MATVLTRRDKPKVGTDVTYEVAVDGKVVGTVSRGRHTTRRNYTGKRYGYDTTATLWTIDTVGGERPSHRIKHTTRKEALARLLSLVGQEG